VDQNLSAASHRRHGSSRGAARGEISTYFNKLLFLLGNFKIFQVSPRSQKFSVRIYLIILIISMQIYNAQVAILIKLTTKASLL